MVAIITTNSHYGHDYLEDRNLYPDNRATLTVGSNQEYSKIKDAIDAANSGDTITVMGGMYYERLFITKTLTIIGDGSTNTILNGSFTGDVMNIKADNCIIQGFTITGSGGGSIAWGGISIESNSNEIIECNLSGNRGSGLRFWESNNNKIKDCLCNNNRQSGIYISDSDGYTIENSKCNSNLKNGITLSDTSDITIKNTDCEKNGHSGIDMSMTENSDFSDSSFNYNKDWGFRIRLSTDNSFRNNDLISNRKHGVFLFFGCNNNEFVQNNFIDNNMNGIQASDNGSNNKWDDGSKGNYWSEHKGKDSDENGIFDNPYKIDGSSGSKDNRPLIVDKDNVLDSGNSFFLILGIVIGLILIIIVILIIISIIVMKRRKKQKGVESNNQKTNQQQYPQYQQQQQQYPQYQQQR